MSDIQARIAALEAELALLRDQLRSAKTSVETRDAPNPAALSSGPRIEVSSAADLTLASCPSHVLELLDALPVQIFVKHAQMVEGRGRAYAFLNKRALSILQWTLEEARTRFDSDAFQGGTGNPEWNQMVQIESHTIEAAEVTESELQWTSPFGDAFRINKTLQLPIFEKDRAGSVVGFCAIAQDIEFKQFQRTNQFFTRAVLHEYGNLCNSIISDITLSLHHPERREKYLKQATNRAMGARNVAKALFEAVRDLDSREATTVRRVLDEITELTKSMPINLSIEAPVSVMERSITRTRVVVAVLLQLITNAEKHTSQDFRDDGVAKVWLRVAPVQSQQVEWRVSNMCKRLAKRLDLSDSPKTVGLTGAILGNIVRRAYPTASAENVVVFPDHLDGAKFVHVAFRPPGDAA